MVAWGGFTTDSTTTFNGPTVSGSDTIGFVIIGHGAEGTVTSVTWDGNAMTRESTDNTRGLHVFSIDNPVSGGSVVITESPLNTLNRYVAAYVTGATAVVQTVENQNTAGAGELTGTLGSNTVSGAAMIGFAAYHGGDTNLETLDSWEVNGSTTGVTEAFEETTGGSGEDILLGGAYDMDGATGSTDSMSVTPSGGDDDLDIMVVEVSDAATGTYLGYYLASNKRALTPDRPLLLSDRKA